jgi:peroxiredoxin
MIPAFVAVAALFSVLLGAVGWALYELLRQNGRLLARIDALERALEKSAGSGRVFADRSLTHSRINRNGLTPGTPAPDFRLPRLDGGEVALTEFRGRWLLLVFSDPECAPCQQLLPRLERAIRGADLSLLVVSRGTPEANRAKLRKAGITLPVALQAHWEISRSYANFSTPVGYLIDQNGVIASHLAAGASAILDLINSDGGRRWEPSSHGRAIH